MRRGRFHCTALLAGLLLAPLLVLPAGLVRSDVSSCPREAVPVDSDTSIQTVVDRAGEGAAFCLRNGVYRGQAVRPRNGQRFYGEGHTILNGSRLVSDFRRRGAWWITPNPFPPAPVHGECLATAAACNRPETLFIDDRPLKRVMTRQSLVSGTFHVDADGMLYLVDDPTAHKVEATMAAFAFESAASDVTISNLIVEKYASPAQRGAIHSREGAAWTIENCEIRLNSGAGISVGSGTRVRHCDVHHNGQIGIEGNGRDIQIEKNSVRSNNTRGFDPAWEAGGVKIAECERVVFRENHVSDNEGPGLWCDIDCRDVVYEKNLVEKNRFIGILHEISYRAVIRDNVLRHNGAADRRWFWGADITLAASQDVTVTGNRITVEAGGCGIVLIDQGRRAENGELYRTRNNTVRGNELIFDGAACAGGTSDTGPGNPNFSIITEGNNRFDENTYRVRQEAAPPRFVWGRDVGDWQSFRSHGLEGQGRLLSR